MMHTKNSHLKSDKNNEYVTFSETKKRNALNSFKSVMLYFKRLFI